MCATLGHALLWRQEWCFIRNRTCSTVEKRACSRRGTPRTRRARNLCPISGLSFGQSCPSTHKRLGDMWSIGQAPTNANRWPSTTQAQRETKTSRNSSSPILTSSAMNTVYLTICLSCQLMHRVPHFHHPHSLSSSSSNNHVAPRRKTVSVDTKRERERETVDRPDSCKHQPLAIDHPSAK